MTETAKKLTGQETIKEESRKLRGNIAPELADANAFVSDASYELLKFHGSYQGYDRDTATERKKQKLDKEWEFMLRLKMPGGRLTAAQYLGLDALTDRFAGGTLRVTTRQSIQYHHILKPALKPLIRGVCEELLSTLGGCGDVVRNVVTSPAPYADKKYQKLQEDAYALARAMTPQTDSYADIWLDGEEITKTFDDGRLNWVPPKVVSAESDPLYGKTYMPRKFKISITIPEDNSMDILINDLAVIALWDGDKLTGYNFYLGGGMGMNHNDEETYPRLATPVAFIEPQDLIAAAVAVVKLQRDNGDRSNRKHARLKYVIAEKGEVWAKAELETYLGKKLADVKPMPPFEVPDHLGWHAQGNGKWFLGIPVPDGRIRDYDAEHFNAAIRTGLRAIVQKYQMPLIMMPDNNVILYNIEEKDKAAIEALLKSHSIPMREQISQIRRDFLACVALPTCGKALAEGERVSLPLIAEFEPLFQKYGIDKNRIAMRLTGCPNGCARPYVGDIGIVGRLPGHYALFIGGDYACTRLNEKIFDRIPQEHLKTALEPMLALYAKERQAGEGFGDFCQRRGVQKMRQLVIDKYGQQHKWAA